MTWRTITVVVWFGIAGLAVAGAVVARWPRSRCPGVGDLVSVAVRSPAGRAAVLVAWMWLGWHAFAR